MSRPTVFSIALFVAFLLVPAAATAQNETLYEASVPVSDQSAAAQAAGLRDALGAVLVKVTGDRAAPRHDELAPVLANARNMVEQFRYEQREVRDAGTGLTRSATFLRARFSPAAVLGALRERGVPIWGRERPATLVWIAYDDGVERGLLDGSAPPEIRAAVIDAAAARGLPLVWPLLDLEDRVSLPFADLWGGFDARIVEASERYRSNAVLVGRVYRVDAERWAVRWTLLDDSGDYRTTSQPDALAEAVAEGPHWVADQFAARFALVPAVTRDDRTRVVVGGIAGVGVYASVMRYLGSLSPVAGVGVEGVDGNEVTFVVDLRGTPQQLQQAIALGTRLVELPEQVEYDRTLRYTIRP